MLVQAGVCAACATAVILDPRCLSLSSSGTADQRPSPSLTFVFPEFTLLSANQKFYKRDTPTTPPCRPTKEAPPTPDSV